MQGISGHDTGAGLPRPSRRGAAVWWYLPLTVLTLGLASWAPFLHAALVLRSRSLRWFAAAYGVVAVGLLVCATAAPVDANGNPVGTAGQVLPTVAGMGGIALIVTACAHQLLLLRKVSRGPEDTGASAIEQALTARARRAEARKLVATDPLLAHELHIGRPDLGRKYDDGGLVDVNHAPAEVIAQVCELPIATAEEVVRARARRGYGFIGVDELLVEVDVPVAAWDRMRDRAVALPG
jgi:hypothetical protein